MKEMKSIEERYEDAKKLVGKIVKCNLNKDNTFLVDKVYVTSEKGDIRNSIGVERFISKYGIAVVVSGNNVGIEVSDVSEVKPKPKQPGDRVKVGNHGNHKYILARVHYDGEPLYNIISLIDGNYWFGEALPLSELNDKIDHDPFLKDEEWYAGISKTPIE